MKKKEILTVLVLLFFLGGCAGVVSDLPKEEARLISHLRGFHRPATKYVQENGMWPQCPHDQKAEPQKFADWWIAELKPYGVEEESWVWNGQNDELSFLPAKMKSHNFEPYRYNKPWFRTAFSVGTPGKYFGLFPDGAVLEVSKDGEPAKEAIEAGENEKFGNDESKEPRR